MQVVEYLKPYEGEVPFRLNNEKWEYCWGKYPNGKTDVAVYRYGTDMAYDYNDFRSAFNLDQERPSAPNKVSENKNQKDNMNTTKTTTNEATVKTAAPKVPTKNFEETKPKSTDASKHVKGSVPAQKKSVATAPTKKTEAPKTVAKDATKHIKGGKVDPAGTTKSQVKPKVGPFEKAKIKENEVITNAATKHLLSMKAGDGHKENMAKIPSESNPGEEKMALGSKGAPATKQETRAPKAPEKKPNESLPAEKSKAAAPPKQETRAPKAPEKTPGEPLKVSKDATKEIKGGAAEVGGKKSSLPNMKEEESWMKTRAGKDGKVFENEEKEEIVDEALGEDESWMNEDWLAESEKEECEVNETEETEEVTEGADEDEKEEVTEAEEEVVENTALNEMLTRMKQILKY